MYKADINIKYLGGTVTWSTEKNKSTQSKETSIYITFSLHFVKNSSRNPNNGVIPVKGL